MQPTRGLCMWARRMDTVCMVVLRQVWGGAGLVHPVSCDTSSFREAIPVCYTRNQARTVSSLRVAVFNTLCTHLTANSKHRVRTRGRPQDCASPVLRQMHLTRARLPGRCGDLLQLKNHDERC